MSPLHPAPGYTPTFSFSSTPVSPQSGPVRHFLHMRSRSLSYAYSPTTIHPHPQTEHNHPLPRDPLPQSTLPTIRARAHEPTKSVDSSLHPSHSNLGANRVSNIASPLGHYQSRGTPYARTQNLLPPLLGAGAEKKEADFLPFQGLDIPSIVFLTRTHQTNTDARRRTLPRIPELDIKVTVGKKCSFEGFAEELSPIRAFGFLKKESKKTGFLVTRTTGFQASTNMREDSEVGSSMMSGSGDESSDGEFPSTPPLQSSCPRLRPPTIVPRLLPPYQAYRTSPPAALAQRKMAAATGKRLILVGPAIAKHLRDGGGIAVSDAKRSVVGWMY